jgi:MOSC domain-containing protein YiiM
MNVFSINRGRAEPITNAKKSGVTGIYKRPVNGAVAITREGVADDVICDRKNHGGPDQAIYIYGMPEYAWWSDELGYQVLPGTFGENLTLTDFLSASMAIGDQLHIGDVILEVTAPRIPCVTLARRMDDPAFLVRFRAAARPGVYCRVISEGSIQVGDPVTYHPYQGERVTVVELFHDFFTPDHDVATLRRHLAAPLAIRARREKEEQLARLLATGDRERSAELMKHE